MSMHTPEPDTPALGTKCCALINTDGYSIYTRACGKLAKVLRNDKPYCGVHDPVRVAERRQARNAKWDEESRARREVMKRAEDERRERHRRAECFPDLLDALKELVRYDEDAREDGTRKYSKGSPMWRAWDAARAAITKAEAV